MLLERLNIKLFPKDGEQTCLTKYLHNMKVNGCCTMDYTPSLSLVKQCKVDSQSVTFTSHKQLDEYVRSVRMKIVEQKMHPLDFESDMTLLKSFDRAFWIRHFKYPNEEQFHQANCPFDNPLNTKSMLK